MSFPKCSCGVELKTGTQTSSGKNFVACAVSKTKGDGLGCGYFSWCDTNWVIAVSTQAFEAKKNSNQRRPGPPTPSMSTPTPTFQTAREAIQENQAKGGGHGGPVNPARLSDTPLDYPVPYPVSGPPKHPDQIFLHEIVQAAAVMKTLVYQLQALVDSTKEKTASQAPPPAKRQRQKTEDMDTSSDEK